MKANNYLTLLFFIFFGTTYSFSVDFIKENYNMRCTLFKATPTEESLYLKHTQTIRKHTESINDVLGDRSKVNQKRPACKIEKEIILKAVMGTVIIHGQEYKLALPKFDESHGLYRHYEILRLTEELSHKLATQYQNKSGIDRACLDDYEDLYAFSGLGRDIFDSWFYETIVAHKTGVDTRTKENSGRATPESISSRCASAEKASDEVWRDSLVTSVPALLGTVKLSEIITSSLPLTTPTGIHVGGESKDDESNESKMSNDGILTVVRAGQSHTFRIQANPSAKRNLCGILEISDEKFTRLREDLVDFSEFYPQIEKLKNSRIESNKRMGKNNVVAQLEREQRIAQAKITKAKEMHGQTNDKFSNDIELVSYFLDKKTLYIWGYNLENNLALVAAYNEGENLIENQCTFDVSFENTIHLYRDEGHFYSLKREENTFTTKWHNFFRAF